MSTVYHRDVHFAKCPKCNGPLKAASFDPDGLHENSIIRCENYCGSGKLKLGGDEPEIEWEFVR